MILDHTHYDTALRIALDVHGGVARRDGTPYIMHVLRVSQEQNTWTGKIIGLLHDVVEDCQDDQASHYEELIRSEFGNRICDAVMSLTRRKNEGEKYFDYIRRVSENHDAVLIKHADLHDNMNSGRDEKSISLYDRYQKASWLLHTINNDIHEVVDYDDPICEA